MADFFTNLANTLGISSISIVLKAILTFLICLIAVKILSAIFSKLLDSSKTLDGTLRGFLKTAIKIALWAIAIVIVAGSLGIDTASLVAVISIAGLALSLAIQNIMSNLFAGITLLVTRPFLAGDYVDIGANSGLVRSVGLFYTVIDTVDNRVVSIPNGDVIATAVVNYSTNELRRVDLNFTASYDSSTEDVKKAILKAVSKNDKILTDPEPFVSILKYNDSNIEYVARVWVNSPDYWDVYFFLNEEVREAFAESGVKMTYPHINVHMDK
ncbi:MAG: mechanosensitive ion channel [Oscillospiraceae bacterium]|nr:mechanosensitive ion channel [Oscillospiraceae bacterium]